MLKTFQPQAGHFTAITRLHCKSVGLFGIAWYLYSRLVTVVVDNDVNLQHVFPTFQWKSCVELKTSMKSKTMIICN
jgi:hypothetical protein